MIIQIEEKQYNLVPNEGEAIRVDFETPDLPTIYAPANVPLSELMTYVKQYAKKRKAKQTSEPEALQFFTIALFDKNYPVKISQTGKSNPYLDNQMIYCSKSMFSGKNQSKTELYIRDYIFKQSITQLCGNWEEKLATLIEDISFKQYKSRPFKITGNTVSFNINNAQYPFRLNEYIVAKAIIELMQSSKKDAMDLLHRTFPDYHQLEKTLSYGI